MERDASREEPASQERSPRRSCRKRALRCCWEQYYGYTSSSNSERARRRWIRGARREEDRASLVPGCCCCLKKALCVLALCGCNQHCFRRRASFSRSFSLGSQQGGSRVERVSRMANNSAVLYLSISTPCWSSRINTQNPNGAGCFFGRHHASSCCWLGARDARRP